MGEYTRHGKETPETSIQSARERGYSCYESSSDEEDDEIYTNRSNYSNTGHFRNFPFDTNSLTDLIIWFIVSYTFDNSIATPNKASEVQSSSYIDNNIYGNIQVTPNKVDTSVNTEPVIFEPIRNIRLSRATYKVTSYINFDPYLTNFDKFGRYLLSFKEDLTDESKMGSLMKEEPTYKLRGYEWDCTQRELAQFGTIRCRFYRQYLRILKEVDVITDLSRAVHQRFLAAIDHLNYYPSDKTSREMRYIQEGEYLPKRQYEELNQAESEFLDIILTEIQKLKPAVHKEKEKEKRDST